MTDQKLKKIINNFFEKMGINIKEFNIYGNIYEIETDDPASRPDCIYILSQLKEKLREFSDLESAEIVFNIQRFYPDNLKFSIVINKK